MKELLAQFGLSEIFAHICPGVIVLYSSFLWISPDLLARSVGNNEIVVAIVALALSYTLGLLASAFAIWTAARFFVYEPKPQTIQARLVRSLLAIGGWLPKPMTNSGTVKYYWQLTNHLAKMVRLSGLGALEVPWDQIVIYRILSSSGENGSQNNILLEADAMHRRFLFSLGVAMALLVAALQCLLRILVYYSRIDTAPLPNSPAVLMCVATVTTTLSFGLRKIAMRWWEIERILTYGYLELSSKASGHSRKRNRAFMHFRSRVEG